MRQFESGATRDSEDGKLDFEGFFSPRVLRRFAEYMNEHRLQADGTLRGSDNWQAGIPPEAYMKSLTRHFFDVWEKWDACEDGKAWEDALCAAMFNLQGLLFETMGAGKGTLRQKIYRSDSGGYAEPVGRTGTMEKPVVSDAWMEFYKKALGHTPGWGGLVPSHGEVKVEND
jgi:hypothetical protein